MNNFKPLNYSNMKEYSVAEICKILKIPASKDKILVTGVGPDFNNLNSLTYIKDSVLLNGV